VRIASFPFGAPFFWRRWLYLLFWRTTAPARAILAILLGFGILMTAAGITWPISLYYLPLLFLAMMFVASVASLLFRPHVRIERLIPERCPAGSQLSLRAKITNVGRLPVFDVTVTETDTLCRCRSEGHPEYVDVLRRNHSAELRYELQVGERGLYRFQGPMALSGFPFGLFHSLSQCGEQARLLVHPRYDPLESFELPVGRRYQPGGVRLASDVADTVEFLANREYRPGDRLQRLDHKAWARLGTPVVHEYQQEYFSRVALILDTQRPNPRGRDREILEAALSVTASISEALSRRDYILDLFVAGPQVYHLRSNRGLARLDQVLDILACIEGVKEDPLVILTPPLQEALRNIGSAVVVLVRWDQRRAEFLRSIRVAGCAVKAILVGDESPSEETVTLLSPEAVDGGVFRL